MKKRVLVALLATALTVSMMTGCGSKKTEDTSSTKTEETSEDSDQEAADKVAKLIDDIYVQERTDKTDEQCKAAKEAWDKLTDAQKELVEGENADPDYFGRDTGDASKDDPLNEDNIGENEILVVSFGTSFNDSRAEDMVEKGLVDPNRFSVDRLTDPATNIEFGCAYLSYLMMYFNGATDKAVAAYNAGMGNVDIWTQGGDILHNAITFPETQAYLVRVTMAQTRYRELYPQAFL